ncbi:NTP transferase domain-containing protein [Oceanibacterium hippocampi]|uniref:Bifunctional protein GlmU n=1 Tax=Oceanibacterium hippocampi TaxID=745714 RepID=A0A1Y5TZP7_9PROT|nr:molybdopterin-binding/glycosyltransferase family 2 protein [Oceanibacterium hippocampi]SLN76893.1 Bifunctional protein GlmU [Oceanibacterium hippocampi]
MKFGRIGTDSAATGAILAHALSVEGRRFRKGHVLTADDVAALRRAGHETIVAARLDPDDVPEDSAAEEIATLIAGPMTLQREPFTGRVNLYADADGILVVDADLLARLNQIDEAVTVATLAPYARVEAGRMIATIKIIPFAAARRTLDAWRTMAGVAGMVRVAAFAPRRVALVMTRFEATKDAMLDKTEQVVRTRLESFGARLDVVRTVPHHEDSVAGAVAEALAAGCDLVLLFGASAITDRGDVLPAGIVAAGGRIEHFGMPVDPGNLLLLGRHDETPVVALPGCARSPKLNGFDWVLERLIAGVAVGSTDLARLGAGGLLQEIHSRPQPRDRRPGERPKIGPSVAAIVLAAGQSRRMGAANKLLEPVGGKPMVAHAVDAALAAACDPVLVVTGHQADQVRAALGDRAVQFVDSSDYAAGLSASLRAGYAALPEAADGAIVMLGDMPRVGAALLDSMIAAFDPREGRAIVVPTYRGKRGNPVLIGREFAGDIAALKGDLGARHLIAENDEVTVEVPIDGDAIFFDIDTPEMLAAASEGSD